MKTSPGNPANNALGPGIGDNDIADAIQSSGYPLQSIVARVLRKHFEVQEEWGFIDGDDHIARSMDLMAERRLYKLQDLQPYVRPTLNLLVECKRSDLPYVFFLSQETISTPRFPLIAGLKSEDLSISTDDDRSTWTYSTLPALGMHKHKFLSDAAFATTFSRCERQGAKIRLSGSDPYNTLIQPLVKALDHFRQVEKPPATAVYFDLHAALALAVIDAPMVGARSDGALQELELLPWVRVPRHKGLDGRSHEHRNNIFAVDIVHVGFLESYIEGHLLPFADEFAAKALKHHVEIAEARGFVPGMGTHWHSDIESRLVPRSVANSGKRVSAVAKGMIKAARGKPTT